MSVGDIVGAHGVRGEVKVVPHTDFPERLADLPWVYVVAPDGSTTRTRIEGIRPHKNVLLVRLHDVSDRTAAERLRGCALRIERSMAASLSEDEYFVQDIIGLTVVTTSGEEVGPVTDVLRTGANDVYVTRRGLIPAVKDVVREVDPERGKIVIEPMEGMLQER